MASLDHEADVDLSPATAMASLDHGLPPNFAGIDGLAFVNHLKSANAGLQKSQFETKGEFEARYLREVSQKLAPIDLNTPYPFLLIVSDQHYDAEKEIETVTFPVGGGGGYTAASFPDKTTPWKVELETWRAPGESYVGKNAYGVEKDIQRFTDTSLSLRLQKLDKIFALAGVKNESEVGVYYRSTITLRIPWKRAEARAAGSEYPIAVL